VNGGSHLVVVVVDDVDVVNDVVVESEVVVLVAKRTWVLSQAGYPKPPTTARATKVQGGLPGPQKVTSGGAHGTVVVLVMTG
jgi:hypothetical protein